MYPDIPRLEERGRLASLSMMGTPGNPRYHTAVMLEGFQESFYDTERHHSLIQLYVRIVLEINSSIQLWNM